MKETAYVTHTCKKCGSAFVDIDEIGVIDTPSRSKYCPNCVRAGFKNKKKRNLSKETRLKLSKRMKEMKGKK